jgi:hypothetical protein
MRLDRVDVQKNGEYVSITPEMFLALPLAERVKVILDRTIRFYAPDGKEIPLQEGLRLLRERDGAAAPQAPEPAPVPLNGNGRVSLPTFLEAPLDRRLTLLLERRVIFRIGNGEAISLKQALQIMHAIQDHGFVEAEHGSITVEACG